MSDVLLDVRELETRFFLRKGVLTAVDRISFQLHENETLGIVGESGCGKSVTAMSLLRLVPDPGKITGGQVIYGGEDLLRKSEPEMQALRGRKISMIFQEPLVALNPAYTVGEQIAECFMIHEGLGKKESYDRAEVALRQVGITAASRRLYSYPHEFSGGMRQRVMIAMALACDPDILIADEPTTALDVTIQAQILALLRDLIRDSKKALIFITHDLGVAAVLCDRIAVMYAGAIVEIADRDALFERPLHPYTQGLLRSLPYGEKPEKYLDPIPGSLCNLMDPPTGCRFHPRCEQVLDVCARECPTLRQVEDHGKTACHLYT
jgi:peptide/nickel transport system ATP-binding protein/oligopeptide transport system ATP-binding protein